MLSSAARLPLLLFCGWFVVPTWTGRVFALFRFDPAVETDAAVEMGPSPAISPGLSTASGVSDGDGGAFTKIDATVTVDGRRARAFHELQESDESICCRTSDGGPSNSTPQTSSSSL